MASVATNFMFKSIGFNGRRQGVIKFELGGQKFLVVAICWPREDKCKITTKKVRFKKVDDKESLALESNKLDKLLALICS